MSRNTDGSAASAPDLPPPPKASWPKLLNTAGRTGSPDVVSVPTGSTATAGIDGRIIAIYVAAFLS